MSSQWQIPQLIEIQTAADGQPFQRAQQSLPALTDEPAGQDLELLVMQAASYACASGCPVPGERLQFGSFEGLQKPIQPGQPWSESYIASPMSETMPTEGGKHVISFLIFFPVPFCFSARSCMCHAHACIMPLNMMQHVRQIIPAAAYVGIYEKCLRGHKRAVMYSRGCTR